MLGIIGAMDREVGFLTDSMEETSQRQIGYTRYTSGRLWGVPVCLARCGIGKVHAALCAQGMILLCGADALLNIGVAGALRDSLAIGDLVIARSAVQHDMDTTPIGDPLGLISGPNIIHMPCDQKLTQMLKQAAEQAAIRWEEGAIATGDQFIVGTDKKNFLADTFGAAACDMEGGAIAQCCYEMQLPYAAVRAISDTRDGDGREYEIKAAEACASEERLLREFIALYRQDQKA